MRIRKNKLLIITGALTILTVFIGIFIFYQYGNKIGKDLSQTAGVMHKNRQQLERGERDRKNIKNSGPLTERAPSSQMDSNKKNHFLRSKNSRSKYEIYFKDDPIFYRDGKKEVLFSPVLRAVKTEDYNVDMGDKILEKNFFIIYESNKQFKKGAFSQIIDTTYPVTFNKNTKALGIVTGSITLKLHDSEDINDICDKFNLKLTYSALDIRTFFVFSKQPGSDLFQLEQELINYDKVARANLEIIDHVYRSK